MGDLDLGSGCDVKKVLSDVWIAAGVMNLPEDIILFVLHLDAFTAT
jgi:hypothetical protein